MSLAQVISLSLAYTRVKFIWLLDVSESWNIEPALFYKRIILPLHLNIAFTLSSVTPTGSLLRHQHRHHRRRCLRHFHHLSTALVEQGTPKWTFSINGFCCLSMNNLLREKTWKRTVVCTGVVDGVDALVLRVEFLGNKLTKSSTVLTYLSFCSYGNFIFALQLCP